jgi:hypothetical protein
MGIGSWIANALGNSASEIITSVKDTVDEFNLSGEEKQQFQIKMKEVELKFQKLQMEMELSYMKDRQSAREMYMKDSSLQKIFAIVFLSGYLMITGFLIYWIFAQISGTSFDMPQWALMLISSIFTAMSTKVNTIVDFLFGGSKSKDDSDARTVQAFKDSKEM